jgi:hypothetical protein
MKIDHPPVYRKVVVPWYDSEIVCLVAIILLFPVLFLGMVGINVANNTDQFGSYLWMPLLLTILSAMVILSVTLRLLKRILF